MRALIFCAALALLALAPAASAVSTGPPPGKGGGMPEEMQTDGDSFWTGAVVPDKHAFADRVDAAADALARAGAAADGQEPDAERTLQSAGRAQLSGYNSAAIKGSSVDVRFSDAHHIHRGWTTFCVTFDSGSGSTHWWGSSPYYANHLTYTQRWTYNGIGISVSVPGGANFSGSGNSIRWSKGYSTVWVVSHGYTGIEGCVGLLGIMYNVSEQHSGDWQITSTAGTLVQANASANVI